MNETAAERARRLRQIGGDTLTNPYTFIWYDDEEINMSLRKMTKNLKDDEEPDVSLVKKYDKGSFKF